MTFLTILTLSSPAWTRSSAEGQTTPTRASPDLRRAKVKKGERAPFAGVLLTSAALAKTITELEKRAEKLRVELEAERAAARKKREAAEKIFKARLEAEAAKRAAVKADLARQQSVYEQALKRANASPPWYKSRYLSFLAGAVISGGVCAGVSATK